MSKSLEDNKLKEMLDKAVDRFNRPSFIPEDPISIPHRFSILQDREIIGFWTAMLSWGQRKTILSKATQLIELMGGSPYDFVLNHKDKDLIPFLEFKHRTFQATDTLYFLDFFRRYYNQNESLEHAFSRFLEPEDETVEPALIGFQKVFFDHPNAPQRTRKHVASPARKSTCKRLNMFLRWMVRKDKQKVDFGDWKSIRMDQLQIPFDVHVERVARHYGLIKRKQRDWRTVLELTSRLKDFDPKDPVKYDYALFGMGVLGRIDGQD
ncbi:MAG: TIGR02757 family protein [Saprospiraceae bacterium]|nr:TIGR02757 family protein [Saprospiraceae bacterium]